MATDHLSDDLHAMQGQPTTGWSRALSVSDGVRGCIAVTGSYLLDFGQSGGQR